MKKRYFCDKVEFWGKKEGFIFFAILLICSNILVLVITMHDHGYVLDLYTSETYEELNQIAEAVITENVGIDLSKLPKNISSYKLNYENDEFTFEFWIDDEDISKYQPNKYMKVQLSNDYMILYRHSPYSSEDEYTNKVDILIATDILGLSVFISSVLFVIGFICFWFTFYISKIKKHYHKLAVN